MRSIILLLLVSLSFLTVPRPATAEAMREIPRSNAKPVLMPAERAKATFEDRSVKAFMSVAAKDFGGRCRMPDPAGTQAITTQSGSGDFSSTFYEVTIPCPGDNGLAAVVITAEFSPPLGVPLDLVL